VQTLFQQITQFGGKRLPHLVITGGDPLERPDLFELISYGRELGLSISVTPAGTQKLTPKVIGQLKAVGISSLGLSLDGSGAAKHDAFRGVQGSFQWTLQAARAAKAEGLPMQINTMVTAQTLDDLPHIHKAIEELEVERWALFFLIPIGRGQTLSEITPEQCEQLLNWLWDLAKAPATHFSLKTTEAHHFRRIAFVRMRRRKIESEVIRNTPVGRSFGVRDGNGIVFVSHVGQVYPSGFLPLAGGNICQESLVDIYRRSELFRSLRDVNRLKGKCGHCSFRAICGGSRARAYAITGDPLESDPLCVYEPGGA
jgi:radical SAM protein